jgi:CheY-like chemotaxis protein
MTHGVVHDQCLAGLRILVVEDDEDTRYIIAKILGEFGASVTDVPSADDALRVIAAMRPDIVLSDINMPVHDGLWFIRELRAAGGHGAIPAVAVTARVDARDRRLILAAGYQAHVPKPVDFDLLADVIQRVVAASRFAAEC